MSTDQFPGLIEPCLVESESSISTLMFGNFRASSIVDFRGRACRPSWVLSPEVIAV